MIDFKQLLPEYIVARDRRRFVRTMVDAFQTVVYEQLQDEIDGLALLTDVDAAPESFLDYIAHGVGISLIGLDTIEQKRTQLKNIVALYKIKGTAKSWEIIFRTIGFDVDVTDLWWDNSGVLVDTETGPVCDEFGVPAPSPVPFLGTAAVIELDDTQLFPQKTLRITASSVGVFGNDISILIENVTDTPAGTNDRNFNLVIKYQGQEEYRFDNLSKAPENFPTVLFPTAADNVEATINGEQFYVVVESLVGSDFRPTDGEFSLVGGAPPRNTKSPYVDLNISVDLSDPPQLNKAVFLDGRLLEVKPAHIRVRVKRISVLVEDLAELVYNDDGLTAHVTAEVIDIMQPVCQFPPGAYGVYFHNSFIRGRDGSFVHTPVPVVFPDVIPEPSPEPPTGTAGYVYAYDGVSGLTYGDVKDSIRNDFVYGIIFDSAVCDSDSVSAVVTAEGDALTDDEQYGVTNGDLLPLHNAGARVRYNGAFNYNGGFPYKSSPIDPALVDADPPDNADPHEGVAIVRRNLGTGQSILVQDWSYGNP